MLAVLAAEPMYGYGIIRAVAELSDGRVELRAGTLYPALDRLTSEGLIDVAREEIAGGRLRRYYRLTDAGAERLAADMQRQRRNAEAAAVRLAARTGGSRHRRATSRNPKLKEA